MEKDGLEFRTEEEILSTVRDIKRLDAHAIAGQDETRARFAPNRDGKHSPQSGEAIRIPLEKARRTVSVSQWSEIGGPGSVTQPAILYDCRFRH